MQIPSWAGMSLVGAQVYIHAEPRCAGTFPTSSSGPPPRAPQGEACCLGVQVKGAGTDCD